MNLKMHIMFRKMLTTLFWLLALLPGLSLQAQKKGKDYYRIGVEIPGLANKEVYLGYHFADKNYVEDTLRLDDKGRGAFHGPDTLPGGVYLLVMPNMQYVEFLFDGNNRYFTIVTDTSDIFGSLRFKGSKENSDFLAYQKQLSALNKELMELHKRVRELKDDKDSLEVVNERIRKINRKTREITRQVVESHPGTFLAGLVQAMTPPDIPEIDIPEGTPHRDSLIWVKRYAFLRDHYLDGVDFSDERLLRSPVLYNRLNQYFNRILVQVPDSVIPRADTVIARAAANDKVYQYVVIFLLNNFQQSNIMGMDAVYVHLAEQYYLSGRAPWADSTLLARMEERVAHMKPNLIGKKAHDLKMETLDGQWVDLYEIDAPYTVLVFWDPNCGHCKQAIPKLHEIYQKYRDKGLKVMAVYIYDNKEIWQKFVTDHGLDDWINVWDPFQLTGFRFYYDIYSTPVIYVLDRDKKIVAKRLDTKTLQRFLEDKLGK